MFYLYSFVHKTRQDLWKLWLQWKYKYINLEEFGSIGYIWDCFSVCTYMHFCCWWHYYLSWQKYFITRKKNWYTFICCCFKFSPSSCLHSISFERLPLYYQKHMKKKTTENRSLVFNRKIPSYVVLVSWHWKLTSIPTKKDIERDWKEEDFENGLMTPHRKLPTSRWFWSGAPIRHINIQECVSNS